MEITLELFGFVVSWFQNLRVFLPRWSFFDFAAPELVLKSRYRSPTDLGEWEPVIQHPQRSVRSLFFNPLGNVQLRLHTLVEQLVLELEVLNESALLQSECFRALERLCLMHFRSRFQTGDIQFQVSLLEEGKEDILVRSNWSSL